MLRFHLSAVALAFMVCTTLSAQTARNFPNQTALLFSDNAASSSALFSQGRMHFVPLRNGLASGTSTVPAAPSAAFAAQVSSAYNGITYHGGPVMLGTSNVYFIWYGNWSKPDSPGAQSVLTDLVRNIGPSDYFAINTTYYDSSNTPVSTRLNYSGDRYDRYSLGSRLSTSGAAIIVANKIRAGELPEDPNAIFIVATSDDVSLPGFKTQFCGFHSSFTLGSSHPAMKYVFAGDAGGFSGCDVSGGVSPNGYPHADATANLVAHELEETLTDPQITAWYEDVDGDYEENADKCAWNFGQTQVAPNGALYNMVLGQRAYLIQQNWVNDNGGYCALSWHPAAPDIPAGPVDLVSKNSGKCLDVIAAPDTNYGLNAATPLQQYACWGGPMQAFQFQAADGGGYKITSVNSGLQLDVQGGPGAQDDGTPIVQWPYWGGSNEKFDVSPADSDGYVVIKAQSSGKCLDVSGISKDDGARVHQWTCWGGDNQKWKILPR